MNAILVFLSLVIFQNSLVIASTGPESSVYSGRDCMTILNTFELHKKSGLRGSGPIANKACYVDMLTLDQNSQFVVKTTINNNYQVSDYLFNFSEAKINSLNCEYEVTKKFRRLNVNVNQTHYSKSVEILEEKNATQLYWFDEHELSGVTRVWAYSCHF